MIELEVVITNGYVDQSTLNHMTDEGWSFVATVPAKNIHPFAAETDKATIFSKYVPYPKTEEDATANIPSN